MIKPSPIKAWIEKTKDIKNNLRIYFNFNCNLLYNICIIYIFQFLTGATAPICLHSNPPLSAGAFVGHMKKIWCLISNYVSVVQISNLFISPQEISSVDEKRVKIDNLSPNLWNTKPPTNPGEEILHRRKPLSQPICRMSERIKR